MPEGTGTTEQVLDPPREIYAGLLLSDKGRAAIEGFDEKLSDGARKAALARMREDGTSSERRVVTSTGRQLNELDETGKSARFHNPMQDSLFEEYFANPTKDNLASFASYAATMWAQSYPMYGYRNVSRKLRVDYEGTVNQAVAWFCNEFDPARLKTFSQRNVENALFSHVKWALSRMFQRESTKGRTGYSNAVSLDAPIGDEADGDTMYAFVGDRESSEMIVAAADTGSRSFGKLYRVLKSLPVKQRKAMVLIMHGKSLQEAAACIGVTRQCVTNYLVQMRRYFTRNDLAKMGYYISDHDYEKAWMEFQISYYRMNYSKQAYVKELKTRLRMMNAHDEWEAKQDQVHRNKLKDDWARYNRNKRAWHKLSQEAKIKSEMRKNVESESIIQAASSVEMSHDDGFRSSEDLEALEVYDVKPGDVDPDALDKDIQEMIRKAAERRINRSVDQENGFDPDDTNYGWQARDSAKQAEAQAGYDYYFGDDEVAVGAG